MRISKELRLLSAALENDILRDLKNAKETVKSMEWQIDQMADKFKRLQGDVPSGIVSNMPKLLDILRDTHVSVNIFMRAYNRDMENVTNQ